jgi:hypothetical protein
MRRQRAITSCVVVAVLLLACAFCFVYFGRVRSSLQGSLLATLPQDVFKFSRAYSRLPSNWQEYARWDLESSPRRARDLAKTLQVLVTLHHEGALVTNLAPGTLVFSLRREGRDELEEAMNQSFWDLASAND